MLRHYPIIDRESDHVIEPIKEKILLVEDEDITREGIDEFLTVKGYHVVAVGDGEEAIKTFVFLNIKSTPLLCDVLGLC